MTKRKYVIITVMALFLVVAIFIVFSRRDDRILFLAVRNHISQHGDSIVTISELVSFEWEKALYFRHHASPQAIYEAAGVDFTGETDLTHGIIFVSQREIVYYEYFRGTFVSDLGFSLSNEFRIMLFGEPVRFFFSPRISGKERDCAFFHRTTFLR